jgi:lactate permease
VAPLFGALGGGLSGSNVGSNALFMPFQVEAATSTDSSRTLLAGVQNVAGSHASFLSPQRVILAATATGLEGREADIVRAAAGPVLTTVALLAVVGLVAA